tara:strand:- start:1025 stop:1234 length:210 start_codon:yes stop_codon:yes gene_type:complete
MLRNSKVLKPSIKKMSQLNYLELKLFLNLSDDEIAEVLENIEGLQHIETFKELKKEILLKYESQKTLSL